MKTISLVVATGILLSACSNSPTPASGQLENDHIAKADTKLINGVINGADNQPSFRCDNDQLSSMARLVCQDRTLATLDTQLAQVFQAASAKAVNEHPPLLKAEQRGWIKGRDECWKRDDKRQCVHNSYQMRIAELQARYRLIGPSAKVYYQCDGIAAKEVVVSYFATEPGTLIAEFGDSVSLMYHQPSGSGSRYVGRNESLWEHQGEARITWGYDAKPMNCKRPQSL
ncbi:MliC family protein [Shewanella sp.]|uniref:MliC family protein n=1 Tax=Shewanella sp. TaxID=50422 RepID=UPI003D0CF30D